MNILQRLAKLANDLDRKGLYQEASAIDELIKRAGPVYEATPPGFQETFHQEPMSTHPEKRPDTDFTTQQRAMQARKIDQIRKRFRVLNLVRREVGLAPKRMPSAKELEYWATLPKGHPKREQLSPFDRDLGRKLQTEYATAIKPGMRPAQILSAVRNQNYYDFAKNKMLDKEMIGVVPLGDSTVQTVHPEAEEVALTGKGKSGRDFTGPAGGQTGTAIPMTREQIPRPGPQPSVEISNDPYADLWE